jgi:hypothetical protein
MGLTYDVLSGSSLAECTTIRITVTLLDMSDRLLIVVISYFVLDELMDGLENGYDYYCITLNMALTTLLMY